MGTLDKYGRLLAYVWTAPPADFAEEKIRDCMFNAILLLEGYAYTYMLMPNTKYAAVSSVFSMRPPWKAEESGEP